MKRNLWLLLIISLLVFTGCNSKSDSIICKNIEVDQGEKLETTVEAVIEDDLIKSINAKFIFDNENSANSFYNIVNIRNEVSDDHYDLGLRIDGTVVYIDNYQYMFQDSIQDGKSNIIGMNKDEYIKFMNDKLYTCE